MANRYVRLFRRKVEVQAPTPSHFKSQHTLRIFGTRKFEYKVEDLEFDSDQLLRAVANHGLKGN